MEITQLHTKHPAFHYQSFKISQKPGELNISFNFFLEPDIQFQPRLQIPLIKDVNKEDISSLVFNLGLVEAISYWKAACSPVFSVEAGPLNNDQISWWHDLFIHGLGEFFYKNKIDFTQPDFLTIHSASPVFRHPGLASPGVTWRSRDPGSSSVTIDSGSMAGMTNAGGDLILVGGGKDSVVTLELTKNLANRRQVMLLNPNPAMLNVSKLAGFSDPIIVKRIIDPKLLELNHEGYLNGHTPFSAYLAFLSLLVGKIYHFKHIIASNEESASVGNTVFHDLEVNHQYSKSFRFEEMFRDYCYRHLFNTVIPAIEPGSIQKKNWIPGQARNDDQIPTYFSFLRPLSELQIAWLFSRFDEYFPVFNSCNVGRGKFWCGKCPKCAFVYLILSPFVPTDKLMAIFGKDLFEDLTLTETFQALVGLDGMKPFECVGTKEESLIAVGLSIAKYQKEGGDLPHNLMILKKKFNIKEPIMAISLTNGLKTHWNKQNFLPAEFEKILKNNLSKMSS